MNLQSGTVKKSFSQYLDHLTTKLYIIIIFNITFCAIKGVMFHFFLKGNIILESTLNNGEFCLDSQSFMYYNENWGWKHITYDIIICSKISSIAFFDVICECVINQKKKSYILKSDTTGFFFFQKAKLIYYLETNYKV